MKRAAGILLPVFSLEDKYGIGSFGKEALEFIDFLEEAGQSYWQILPIGPTGYGNSPYQSYSTYAINPLLIDVESLIEDDLLTQLECSPLKAFSGDYIDYEGLTPVKIEILRKAYERFAPRRHEMNEFLEKEGYWLHEYALFMALHRYFKEEPCSEWPEEYRLRHWDVLDRFRQEHEGEIGFYQFMQYVAATQWHKVKEYANEKDIQIIGDIPIYVSPDSSDLWQEPALFQLNEKGKQDFIAGCPGDDYAPDGQLWGNPLYNWDYHRQTGFDWWGKRMRKALELFDIVRIDHFRGFDEYFSIPAEDENAHRGTWQPGPRMELFHAFRNMMGDIPVIAEDLGFLTDGVRSLLWESKYPGMKVLQFAFDGGPYNTYLPLHYDRNSVVYTGTHDNPTTLSWVKNAKKEILKSVKDYLGLSKKDCDDPGEIVKKLVLLAHSSISDTCIIPLQDYLVLDDKARINTPSTVGGLNWKWQVKDGMLTDGLAEEIKDITKRYAR